MAFQSWPIVGKFMVGIVPVVMTTAALLILCIALELIAARDDERRSRWFGAFVQAAFPILAGLIALPVKLAWFSIGVPALVDLSALPPFVQIALLVVLADFLGYWEHRFEHRFYWPVHAVHHSQTDLHAASGYGHPLQSLPLLLCIIMPLSLVDSSAHVPAIVGLVLGFQLLFIHAPIRWHLGPLRRLWCDGPYHRIHHSLEARHFGKNYGTGITLWDQLFGTAYFPAQDEWPDTGVEGIAPPTSFTDYLAKPFRMRWFA